MINFRPGTLGGYSDCSLRRWSSFVTVQHNLIKTVCANFNKNIVLCFVPKLTQLVTEKMENKFQDMTKICIHNKFD